MSLNDSAVSATELQALVGFRRELHQHPETGFEVAGTAAAVSRRLEQAGLEVTTSVGGHGVVATLGRGGPGRSIGLRADLDALPITEANDFPHRSRVQGSFHGCGHDGHTAMLLGAAQALARRDDLEGQVHFIFQPNEENGLGAQAMIDDGLFQRFPMDAIYGLHNLPGLPVGQFATRAGALTAFEELFEIHVQGRGGHASAPDRVIDPVVAGAELVLALQSIVARSLSPRDHGVVSITELLTDGARNIIPSRLTLKGDVRGYDEAVSETIQRRIRELTGGIAAAHGAYATVSYRRDFEPVVNTGEEVGRAAAAVRRIPGAQVDPDCPRVGFSEDFAQFLNHRPGCFILMGNGTDGHHGATLHNPGYDFNDEALPVGVRYWTELALECLGR